MIWLIAGTCQNQTIQQLMALANGTYFLCRNVDLTTEILICERDVNDICTFSGEPLS